MYCNHFKNPLTCMQCTPEDRLNAIEAAKSLLHKFAESTPLEVSKSLGEISLPTPKPEIVYVAEEVAPVKETPVVSSSDNAILIQLETVTGGSINFHAPVCPESYDLIESLFKNIVSHTPALKSVNITHPRKFSI